MFAVVGILREASNVVECMTNHDNSNLLPQLPSLINMLQMMMVMWRQSKLVEGGIRGALYTVGNVPSPSLLRSLVRCGRLLQQRCRQQRAIDVSAANVLRRGCVDPRGDRGWSRGAPVNRRGLGVESERDPGIHRHGGVLRWVRRDLRHLHGAGPLDVLRWCHRHPP